MMAQTAIGTDAGDDTAVFIEDQPFRPVFERCAELGMVACVHPSSNISGPDAVSSGGFAERVSERLGVHHTVAEPAAYMQDADLFVTTALFHGLLEDLPNLRIAIAHAGTTWVPLALEKCETYLWLGMGGGVPVCLEPEEVWERHPIVTSFDSWERPVARMADRIGTKAAWGSRYPQHDTGTPEEARRMLEGEGVDEPTINRLMGEHATEIFGLPVKACNVDAVQADRTTAGRTWPIAPRSDSPLRGGRSATPGSPPPRERGIRPPGPTSRDSAVRPPRRRPPGRSAPPPGSPREKGWPSPPEGRHRACHRRLHRARVTRSQASGTARLREVPAAPRRPRRCCGRATRKVKA